MERSFALETRVWQTRRTPASANAARLLGAGVITYACAAAALAGWLPLQISIVTVFLFAGPHNWFEFRYFLMRLPIRFGRSRNFFITAFAGIGGLTLAYCALPVAYHFGLAATENWPTIIATWNSLLIGWLALLIWLRAKNKRSENWFWTIPLAFAVCAANWMAPEIFSLALVYLHPLIALWFLDRHLRRNRPEWLRTYHRSLAAVLFLLVLLIWRLAQAPDLTDDNGLFWRISQHAGAELLPQISSRLLVSVHVFLEMLHYAVWIIALPLIIAPASSSRHQRRFWNSRTIPLARHPRGFPNLVKTALVFGLFVVGMLWFGFAIDYATTRDIYFTVAMAHVLAEAPFLLKML